MSDHNSLGDAHRTVLDGLDLGHLTGHIVSLGAIAAVIAGVLPALAAAGAVIWYCIAIYETKTFQRMLKRRRLLKIKRRASHDTSKAVK